MHRNRILRSFCLLCLVAACQPEQPSTELQTINPSSLPPARGYSHVAVAPSGQFVSIAGQVAMDSTGAVVGIEDFEAQCAQVFKNLDRALRSIGATFDNVVRTDVYVTDFSHVPSLHECRAQHLTAKNPPAGTLLQVDALIRPELMIEIAAEAVIPIATETSSVQRQQSVDTATLTEQAVLDFIRAYDTAWEGGDTLSVAQAMASDHVYFSSTGGVRSGGWLLNLLADSSYTMETTRRSELDVQLHGDVAVVSSRWQGTGSYQGEPIEDDQRCSMVIQEDSGTLGLLSQHCTQIVASP